MISKIKQARPSIKEDKITLQLDHLLNFSRPSHTNVCFPKRHKMGVVRDKTGEPHYFLFDTFAFWELLCQIDEAYEKNVSDKVYIEDNPVGWLIDAIEAKWQWKKESLDALQKEVTETQKEIKTGKTATLDEVAKELGLVSS